MARIPVPSPCHSSAMLQFEILIGEFFAVDGFAPGAIAIGEVSTLDTFDWG